MTTMRERAAQRANSKAYRLGMAVAVLGYAQENFDMIAPLIGAAGGWVTFGIGIAIIIVRELTNAPLSQKPRKLRLKPQSGDRS